MMVNLKMSKKEATEYGSTVPSSDGVPEYPYGLRICLDEEALAKLGLTDPLAPGTPLKLHCIGFVQSASANKTQTGADERDVSIQITDMEVDKPGPSAANVLYG
jgi:hypothetical protein